MFGKHPFGKFLVNSLATLQLLSWSVEARWENNYTLIKLINSMNLSWKAGENPADVPGRLPKLKPRKSVLSVWQSDVVSTPEAFDSRTHWKNCRRLIGRIRSQGRCGSCWAVATVSMISDRMCIESNGTIKVNLSAEDVITCCDFCMDPEYGGSCSGGFLEDALFYWIKHGIVTGGEVDSDRGCKPYSSYSYNGFHQPCKRKCTNKRHRRRYEKDKYRGQMLYRLAVNEDIIKSEIFTHGPVVCAISVYEDFHQYRTGVYRHAIGEYMNPHALKIIGWGTERGEKYWMAANSHGRDYGLNGYVKIVRGENHCNIEEMVTAGRMYHSVTYRYLNRKADSSGAKKRCVLPVEEFLLCAFCAWIVTDTFWKHYS